uniref:Uncharacterized protein n=1 Tax=Heterorhabditis bacteriophora TaxID=37862 RepID=A0A1I7WBP5_HETBA
MDNIAKQADIINLTITTYFSCFQGFQVITYKNIVSPLSKFTTPTQKLFFFQLFLHSRFVLLFFSLNKTTISAFSDRMTFLQRMVNFFWHHISKPFQRHFILKCYLEMFAKHGYEFDLKSTICS